MAAWMDIRFAMRQLRKSPAFTLVVLATLGLCIGANTAVYSVLDAVLIRPAPYPQPERLALVETTYRHANTDDTDNSQTGYQFETVRNSVPGLDAAAFALNTGANFSAHGRPEYVRQGRVSTGYFRVLGVAPQFGREFSRQEDMPGGPAVTILSYGFWQRVFEGDPAVLGRSIDLRGEPYTVVGIMPSGFRTSEPTDFDNRTTEPVDLWTPLRPSREGEGGGSNYGVVARIKPGVTWAEAAGQLRALGPVLAAVMKPPSGTTVEERMVRFQSGMAAERRSELLIAWAAVLVVLLIGCVNIAGLQLARANTRAREIATRMALGGGRAAIVRQLMVESSLLALGGCAVGILVGEFAIDGLKRLGAAYYQLWHPIELDGRVLLVMLGVSLLTGLLFGLAPALQTSRLDIRAVLIEGGRGVAGGGRRWFRHLLVAGEVALSLTLLVSAGLLLRTLGYLNGLDPGFDPRNVIAAEVSLQDARYQTRDAVSRLFTGSLDRIRRIPGVESAAAALTLPYERPLNDGFQALESGDRETHMAEMVYLTPGYFETLRIPVLEGRTFRDADTSESRQVAVVSRAFAVKYFRGAGALGRHVKMGRNVTREIVGVVGDVQQHSGLEDSGPTAMEPTLYIPVSQTSSGYLQVVHVWFSPKWVIRAIGQPGEIETQVQSAVAGFDPQLPIAGFKTVEQLRGFYTRNQRYDAALFSILAGLALLLAAIGLYGLISQSIAQRTHELGVRMALGATASQTIAEVMKPGILLALAGVAAGCGLALAAVHFLRHLLWGIQPTDPLTFASMAALLLAVAALASLLPALRLLRLDPANTLRGE